ncbi:MAG: PAS domain S-box protein, partial [Spirochaetaceae bacterium]|nr:PAS domain S-box protein [Spirochaetaceae bacterium]
MKNRSTKSILLLILASIPVLSVFPVIPDPLRVAFMPELFPISYWDEDGNPDGIFPRIISEIARNNDIDIEWIEGSRGENLERTRRGEIDLMFGMVYTQERDMFLDYNRESAVSTWSQVFQTRDGKIQSLFDIKGKRVGMVSGDQNARGFVDLTESFDIDFVAIYYDGFDQVYEDMASGELDAGVFFNLYQLSQPDMSPTSIIFQPNNSYFAVPEGAEKEMLELIDRTLVSWKSDNQSFYYTEVMELLSTKGSWKVPQWQVFLNIGLVGLALAASAFVLVLRLQVRQRTADLLEAQESYLSTFVEADVGMCHVDADGRLLRVNPWLCSYLGYDEQSLLKMKFSDFTHEKDLEATADIHSSLVENHRTSYRINKRYVSKDGRTLWAHVTATGVRDSEGRLSYITVLIEDINARLEAQKMVDDLQKRYRSMFNNSYQMTALFDEAGRFLDVNQTLKKVCRLPDDLEGSLGKTPGELEWFGTIGSLRVQEMLDECLMTGQPIRHTLGLEDTGTGMALDMTIKPIFDENQNIKYCVTEAHDVTDMVNLTNSLEQQVDARTREIRDAQDRLVESEKLAALGRLVAGIALEINTPLGVAKTGASYLLEQVSDTKRRFNEQALSKEDFLHMLDSFAELGEILEKNLDRAAILI